MLSRYLMVFRRVSRNTMVVLIYDKTIPVRRKEYIHYNNRCA
ncbi:hypothetical protein UUU_01230 [Klebsiella pneumoniae subsp. pneumoniae DSM 30104 = JCM 1662 = NBRC 14940]|nr:hypothetical protein UUU_01230 [Klebsiella pneumoniae subsp. pneumoniae DSM 30104 = JCM 1662 = NBRC 14940]